MFFSASLACAEQLRLADDIQSLIVGGIDNIHIDIMDGHNVPNFALNFDVIREIRQLYPDITINTHFMTETPEQYVERSKTCGVDWMIFDSKEAKDSKALLNKIKEIGMLAGIVLNPDDDIKEKKELILECDVVLVMGVKPGANGQKFLPETTKKIAELSELRKDEGINYIILIDGGINRENAIECVEVGADGLVLGALAIFNQNISVLEASKIFLEDIRKDMKEEKQ